VSPTARCTIKASSAGELRVPAVVKMRTAEADRSSATVDQMIGNAEEQGTLAG
jgi:hypothetical protein